MYTYIYIYTCIHIYIYIHTHTYTHTHTYARMYICVHVYKPWYACASDDLSTHVHESVSRLYVTHGFYAYDDTCACIAEEPRIREPRIREPRIREPRIQEPRIREPRIREPRIREPRIREPRIRDPGCVRTYFQLLRGGIREPGVHCHVGPQRHELQ